ncbi:unnamed protein product [Somion occarium]|uniref:Uncharacterized protein n=1 Tax=Somion occarium TaxID=3059160 RepID=A0ABP1DFT6_9APHY
MRYLLSSEETILKTIWKKRYKTASPENPVHTTFRNSPCICSFGYRMWASGVYITCFRHQLHPPRPPCQTDFQEPSWGDQLTPKIFLLKQQGHPQEPVSVKRLYREPFQCGELVYSVRQHRPRLRADNVERLAVTRLMHCPRLFEVFKPVIILDVVSETRTCLSRLSSETSRGIEGPACS